jgi:hypothetical protein
VKWVNTYGMQERDNTCKGIFGTNIMGIIEHNIIMYFEETLLENTGQILMAKDRSGGVRGGVVVKILRYKPAGRGFDYRWCHWNFSVT